MNPTPIHTCTYSNPDSPLQRSLPETRVHYCSLTSASSLTATGFSPSVTFFCVCCHWMMCVCEEEERVRGRFAAAWLLCMCQVVFWVYNDGAVVSPVPQIVKCVCMCTVSCWGYMCGAVCPQGLSPQWPQRRLSQRETEREKEGERVPLLSPHTHTLIIIPISGNGTLFLSWQSCFQLLSAL